MAPLVANSASDLPLELRFGLHRVREPQHVLPQAAWRLDNAPEPAPRAAPYELLIDVERLNIDAASCRQMEEAARTAGEEPHAGVARLIRETIDKRGKMHNPVTGSGGMLLGRVHSIGDRLPEPHRGLRPGERIATLVSLSLTPLHLDEIKAVHLHTHQVDVRGRAVLFASGAWARLPDFVPENVALAALDVAGAGPQVSRLCARPAPGKEVRRLLVLGCGGKSGLIVAAAARRAGVPLVVGVENQPGAAADAESLGLFDRVLSADATDALSLAEKVTAAGGGEYDLVVSCVSVARAEMAAILPTRTGGTVYFFSMATSFTAAALGAEGVSKDIDMLVGNGYCTGHADETLALLREHKGLRELFIKRYA
ncbi:MAG TPA: zinc-binding dehydrogenase [Pseudomonadota bacterium]|nr:zinc-binding dehydrogenase [Pseudomonadota bacterium]